MSHYQASHGQAVAIGIMLDSIYAMQKGWLSPPATERIYQGLTDSGFVLWHDLIEQRRADGTLEILQGLRDFQEHLGGELSITFPRGLGNRFEVDNVDPALVEQAVRLLKQRRAPGARTF